MTHKLSYIKKACLSKKTSKLIYITFYIITINAICLIPPLQSVLALTEAQRDQFAANNILFYDPEGSAANSYCISSNADCGIMGTTRDEKLWSGLRHVGFDPEQTAALMGNILNEGGTPTTQEYAYIYARNFPVGFRQAKRLKAVLCKRFNRHFPLRRPFRCLFSAL